jgi:MerR family transcriptional regulator, light-induced transcriptional regulator
MELIVKTALSPKNLAQAIGISESSLKRWADDGQIHVMRTAGGHRRIAVEEAVRFIREMGIPLVQPDALGLGDLVQPGKDSQAPESAAERLFMHLRTGEAEQARGLMISLYLAGHSIAAIADGPIRLALQRLGEMWKHDSAGIFLEHRATEICVQAVQHLRLLVEERDGNLVAVGGAPGRDPYLLPTLLAAIALKSEGVQAVNLGPNTPFEALHEAVLQHRPALVWLSVSHLEEPRKLEKELSRFAGSLADAGVMFVLGGQALHKLHVVRGGNIHIGQSMAELAAFAKGLRASKTPVNPLFTPAKRARS